MNIKELVYYLGNKGCLLKGCSIEQVAKIEKHFGVKLPLAYKKFLLSMGICAGTFMLGSSVFYDEIYSLKESAIELLEEDNFEALPEETFVFYMHQGYQFAFFYLTNEEDPPIYYYYEGVTKNDFERKEESFTNFLEKQLSLSGLK